MTYSRPRPPTETALRRAEAATWGPRLAPAIKIRRFVPHHNTAGTMLAFLTAETPSGMIVHGLKLMIGPQGKHWIALPNVKRRDPDDDRPMLNEDGRPIWDPVIEFASRDARDRFGALVLEALRRAHPEAFDGERVP
jgi:DNA-binding cell septation regulator SpoVG